MNWWLFTVWFVSTASVMVAAFALFPWLLPMLFVLSVFSAGLLFGWTGLADNPNTEETECL